MCVCRYIYYIYSCTRTHIHTQMFVSVGDCVCMYVCTCVLIDTFSAPDSRTIKVLENCFEVFKVTFASILRYSLLIINIFQRLLNYTRQEIHQSWPLAHESPSIPILIWNSKWRFIIHTWKDSAIDFSSLLAIKFLT